MVPSCLLISYPIACATPFWIYIVLFAGIGIIIVISIFWRVWNAAKQNPAEVVKTE
jgi:ABC-type antimicrobial peptide transport system permease subunit